jgi:hypothetical protein
MSQSSGFHDKWRWVSHFLIGGLIFLALPLAGCGGGSDGGGSSSGGGGQTPSGEVVIGITDAEGDFISYSVDILSITLTKANGAVVETLPLRTRVDFAQYTEMTEFVTAATIPSGVYTGAKIRLDYTNADIRVEDAGGQAVAAVVKDPNGQPITTLELTVNLDDRASLLIVPGVPAHLTLDFNLKASNTVNTGVSPPVVTVQPFLVAQVNQEDPKTHRVRGPLKSVNLNNSSYQVILCPYHRLTGDFGTLTILTGQDTVFEIDGVSYKGAEGLSKLAAKPFGTATVAVGDQHMGFRRFVAQEVYAGSSVAYGTNDAVTGSVIARSGDNLTLRGATLVRKDGTVIFNDNVTIQMADSTIVTGQGTHGTVYTIDDISVGQHISALGALSGSPGSYLLDAKQGLVRMQATVLTGTVNHFSSGSLNLNLQTINGRKVSLFNFAGTGTTSADDADPANYQVSTGTLSLSGLSSETPVRVRGLVRPFGQGPPDFIAWTIINTAALPATLFFDWNPASGTPFSSVSPTGVALNTAGVGPLHHVLRGWVWTDVLPNSPVVQPKSASLPLYAICYQGSVQLYTQFDAYSQALQASLSSGKKARLLSAYGTFTDATTTLDATRVFAAFQ